MTIADTALAMVGKSRAEITSVYNSIVGTSFPDGTAWCSIFCTVALHAQSSSHPEWYTAFAPDWMNRAKKLGMFNEYPEGDGNTIVSYDWNASGVSDHVEVWLGGNGDSFDVISGNAPSLGSERTVVQGHRSRAYVQGFINLNYSDLDSGDAFNPPEKPCDVIDFSVARPSPTQLVASGIAGVMIYLGEIGWPKAPTANEISGYLGVGLGVGLIYERSGTSWRGGFQSGVDDANEAISWCDNVGVSHEHVCFALDSGDQVGQESLALDYIAGFQSIIPGGYPYCAYSVAVAYGRECWQTYAWSGGAVAVNATLYQFSNGQVFNGSEVDYNEDMGFSMFLYEDGTWHGTGGVPTTPTPVDPNPVSPPLSRKTTITVNTSNSMTLKTANGDKMQFIRNNGSVWLPVGNMEVKIQ